MPFLPSDAPRCLQSFGKALVTNAEAMLPPEYCFKSYRLICPCGGETWRVLGYAIPGSQEFDDPLEVECCRCGELKALIDCDRDGYDGEIGGGNRMRSAGPKETWACPQCHTADGRLIASFGYQFEPFGSHEPESSHAQDFFDTFLLRHFCLHGDGSVEIVAFECA
jgi:hypothetical protein